MAASWRPLALAGALLGIVPCPAGAAPLLDDAAIARHHYGHDAPWYLGNIPFFEASDPMLERIYYYRWAVLRAHQRDLGALGYVTTEFLDDVSWQRQPYATLNDSASFHIAEARWLSDRRYAGDYIDYLYQAGGNDRHFSESIADAAWGRYLVDGDRAAIVRHLPAMRRLYDAWNDRFDAKRGLYWIPPIDDATEYSVASIDASGGVDGFHGGDAFRPSINVYMYANARAIANVARLAGDRATAAVFSRRADALRDRIHAALWSGSLGHFIDRHRKTNEHVREWQPIGARELVGFVPWAFGLPRDEPRLAAAWSRLLDPTYFGGAAGPRTVEPGYRYYLRQFRYDKETGRPECQWNGPVWPFQTTQVLLGMARLLRDHRHAPVGRNDWNRVLRDYARLHLLDGQPDLQEDYHPESGRPIVGLARSHHYNHSGFNDLVIGGLVGIRPRDDALLEVDPLAVSDGPHGLRWFALENLSYRGRRVSVVFDADGRRYRRGAGMTVTIDGRVVARASRLERVRVRFSPRAPVAISRPLNLATRLDRGGFPRVTASTNATPEALHEAVDGRVWFFPEMANGWTAPRGMESWIALDLGRTATTRAAELAFVDDGASLTPPAAYRIQRREGDEWVDMPVARWPPMLGGGITRITWPETRASRVRLLLTPRRDFGARLVEMKLF